MAETLELALDALISIEKGIYPSDECLDSLIKSVHAWLEPEREKSLAASSLFKQATQINRNNKKHALVLENDINVLKLMNDGLSKTNAISKMAEKSLNASVSNIWLNTTNENPDFLVKKARDAKLQRIAGAVELHKANLNKENSTLKKT